MASYATVDKRPTVLKLVPEFSGEGDVSEWLEKVHTVCFLNDVVDDRDVLYVITLRLTGEAYRLVQQLDSTSRCSRRRVTDALLTAYEANLYDAYNMFRARRWKEGESVDGYLSALRKLAKLCGGAGERMVMAAFVSGLPADVQDVIRSGVGANVLQLEDALNQARQIINKRGRANAKCLASMDGRRKGDHERPRPPVTCYTCGKQGHWARECPHVVCFKCQKQGHISRNCSGNAVSE